MTDSIILCEGETDQALVGCYMEKVAGWRYIKNAKEEPFPNESTHWYHDSNGYMDGIWQVGGNEFSKALSSIFGREKLEHSIERIVIITDHDDQGAETNRLSEIKEVIETVLGDQLIDIQLLTNQWGSVFVSGSIYGSKNTIVIFVDSSRRIWCIRNLHDECSVGTKQR